MFVFENKYFDFLTKIENIHFLNENRKHSFSIVFSVEKRINVEINDDDEKIDLFVE